MNPMKILQLKSELAGFNARHPKVVRFFKMLAESGVREGSVMELSVTSPEGETICANLKVTSEDLELLVKLKEIQN